MNNDIIPGFDDSRDDNLKIRLEKLDSVPGSITVGLTGHLDTFNHLYFDREMALVFKAGFQRLLLDLRGLYYASSSGVGSLIELQKDARVRAGDIVLLQLPARVFTIIELLGFAQFFNLANDRDEALRLLAPSAAAPLFPRVFACPICGVKLRAGRAGRYRCSHCRTILALADTGAVDLG
jgi:anti-sigma B factor antagonist